MLKYNNIAEKAQRGMSAAKRLQKKHSLYEQHLFLADRKNCAIIVY